jgi:hypothetical protein
MATGPAATGVRDWIDTAIEWASGLAAVGMFAYGAGLSYAVLHGIAAATRLPGWAARVWPLGFEAFMASAALNALAEQRHRRAEPDRWRRVPWYPWTLTALTAGASIALNWLHPVLPLAPPPAWLVSVVYGLPPLIAVLAWHLFLGRVAHRRHATPPAPPVPAASEDDGPGGMTARDHPTGATARDREPTPAVLPAGPSPAAPSGPARPPTGTVPSHPRSAGTAGQRDTALLARARAAAAAFEGAHGRPIGRDALRRALGVSNQTASLLLRTLRTTSDDPKQVGTARDHDGHGPGPAAEPAGPDRGTVPGNGHPSPPAVLAELTPAGGRDGEGSRDA